MARSPTVFVSLIGAALALGGCGVTEAGNPKKPDTKATPLKPSSLYASDALGEQFAFVIGALSDAKDAAASFGLALALVDPGQTCAAEVGTGMTRVERTRVRAKSDARASATQKVALSFESKETLSQTWSGNGTQTRCHPETGKFEINWPAATGMTLKETYSARRTHTVTVTDLATQAQSATVDTSDVTGERARTWKSAMIVAETLTTQEDIVFTLKSVRTLKDAAAAPSDARARRRDATVATQQDAPLFFEQVRSKGGAPWSRRVVRKGTIQSVGGAGESVKSTYSDVTFEFGKCLPTAGMIMGEVSYAADAAQPRRTFKILFAPETGLPRIEFNDGESQPLLAESCDE